eukprot:scaffold320018_cov32-Tisochrysis_lutea.AAC.6
MPRMFLGDTCRVVRNTVTTGIRSISRAAEMQVSVELERTNIGIPHREASMSFWSMHALSSHNSGVLPCSTSKSTIHALRASNFAPPSSLHEWLMKASTSPRSAGTTAAASSAASIGLAVDVPKCEERSVEAGNARKRRAKPRTRSCQSYGLPPISAATAESPRSRSVMPQPPKSRKR